MIDLTIDKKQLARTIQRARERGIIIPTFKQQKDPTLIPDAIKANLKNIGLWDITSLRVYPKIIKLGFHAR